MTLVDTSVWVDHFRNSNSRLQALLRDNEVVMHPFIIGELACGNLKNREALMSLLGNLPSLEIAQHTEVLSLIEANRLFGRGIGWIDVHLLAAVLLSHTSFWTLDKRLASTAVHLKITR